MGEGPAGSSISTMPPRRAPVRIFPSTLVTNTHKAEGIFKQLARGAQQQDGGDAGMGAAAGMAFSSGAQLRGPSPSPSAGAAGSARALTGSKRRAAAAVGALSSRRGGAGVSSEKMIDIGWSIKLGMK